MKIENEATKNTPAKTYKERLEQALLWAIYELDCDQSGHGGVEKAIRDLVPDFSSGNLVKKGYTLTCPEIYDDDTEDDLERALELENETTPLAPGAEDI